MRFFKQCQFRISEGNDFFVRADCPLCQSSPQSQQIIFQRGRSGAFIEQDGALFNDTHVYCLNCGLVFINPQMKSESLQDFYNDQYRKLYKGNPKLELLRAKWREQFLRTQNLLGSSNSIKEILDVGSSTGAFPF